MVAHISKVRDFWDANPCNSSYSAQIERKAYFDEIERIRFETEPHIPIMGRFDQFRGRHVLEVGCGIGTDGLQFAKHGALYVGVDLTPSAINISRERFGLYDVPGRFEIANAEVTLPFPDNSFDHIYSCGVIHHSPDTEAIVAEMHRVLKPGGTFTVMVYNKTSINYYIEIMCLRKIFRVLLFPPFMPSLLAKLTGFDEWKLRKHRDIVLARRRLSAQEWLSMNTDGPDNPLSKVYARQEALALFRAFEDVSTEVWHFNTAHWPLISNLLPRSAVNFLGRHWGWHRIIYGRKPVAV